MDRAVSTHSHPKVAAITPQTCRPVARSFNTQPREGGCSARTTAPDERNPVSTHSRAKAAAKLLKILFLSSLSFNTQPREGGCGM